MRSYKGGGEKEEQEKLGLLWHPIDTPWRPQRLLEACCDVSLLPLLLLLLLLLLSTVYSTTCTRRTRVAHVQLLQVVVDQVLLQVWRGRLCWLLRRVCCPEPVP